MGDTRLSHTAAILRSAAGFLWRIFEALANFIDLFLRVFGVALLVGMWGLLLFNTLYRWAGGPATGWGMEIIGFMVAWSIFVMAGPVTKRDMHIKVNFFPEKLLGAKRGAIFMHVLENMLGLGICIFLTIQAYRFVAHTYELGYKQTSVSGWEYPLWTIRCGILVGFLFLSFYYFERTVKFIAGLFWHEGATSEEKPRRT